MKGCYIIVLVVERNENKTQGYALLAQLVEQRTLNPSVQSSSLCAPTIAIFSPTPFQLSLLLVCFLIFLRNNLKISVQFRSFLSKKQHLTLQ